LVDKKIVDVWDYLQKSAFDRLDKCLDNIKGEISLEQEALLTLTRAIGGNNRGEYSLALSKMLKLELFLVKKLKFFSSHKFLFCCKIIF
jgi:hypothetical protein